MRRLSLITALASTAILFGSAVYAQQPAAPPPPPPAYGTPITLDQARTLAAAAEAEAKKNSFKMVIAIVEPSGQLVVLHKMDDTLYGSINVAIGKAKSAAMFKRPTNVFNELLGKGNTYLLGLEGANMVPGGFPIIAGGKIIGAIGVSGATGAQDSQVAQAGVAAVK